MITINFISLTETVNRVENNKVVNVKTHSANSKITALTYLDLNERDIDSLNRKSKIRLDFYVAGQYPSGEIVATNCYHSRYFNFETIIPTNDQHLLNFRYKDEKSFEYFTVIDKRINKIIEAGFIERDLFGFGKGANIVIDTPNLNLSQNVLFRKVDLKV